MNDETGLRLLRLRPSGPQALRAFPEQVGEGDQGSSQTVGQEGTLAQSQRKCSRTI